MSRYHLSVTHDTGRTTHSKYPDKHSAMRAYEYDKTSATTWFMALTRTDTLRRTFSVANYQNEIVHERKMADAILRRA